MDFILANWYLFAGVAVVTVLLALTAGGATLGGLVSATPAQLVTLINQEKAVLFDLRGAEQFAAGHLADSRNVSAADLPDVVAMLAESDQPLIVLVCDRQAPGAAVAKQLKQAGIKKVYELKGGVDAWRDEQLPLVKS